MAEVGGDVGFESGIGCGRSMDALLGNTVAEVGIHTGELASSGCNA